ncbi:MAG: hypothetical protein CR986_10185 [Ignavibacteriae bacterium]|nr:MAG: hypothetical protein CR986_10185 [Ignavibacteriota bacterium]
MQQNIQKILILLFLFTCGINAQKSLSLSEAVQIAETNNFEIKRFEEKVKQKEKQNLSAIGNFLPKVNVSWSFTHLDEPMDIDLTPIRTAMIKMQAGTQTELANIYGIMQGAAPLTDMQKLQLTQQNAAGLNKMLPEFITHAKKQDYQTATITAIQPLFLGGKLIAAKKYAKTEVNSANFDLQKKRDEIISVTTDIYLKIVLLEELVSVRKNVVDGITKHKVKAEKALKNGLANKYDLLRAEVALADAKKNLDNDLNKLATAYDALKNNLGITDDSIKIKITDKFFEVNFEEINDIAYYKNEAESHQPILKMIASKKEAAHQNTWIKRSKFLPQVAGFGKYEMYPEYLSLFEPRWAVGVKVSLSIFNGFKDYLDLETASYLEDEVNYLEKDTKQKIGLLVNKYYNEIKSAVNTYKNSKKVIELAKENLKLNNKRFDIGLGTSLEHIDAQLLLEKNQLEASQALYNYFSSKAKLLNICGKPNEFINFWNSK